MSLKKAVCNALKVEMEWHYSVNNSDYALLFQKALEIIEDIPEDNDYFKEVT